MKDKFLIGELAKLHNVSTDTLRHYDKLNLLKPVQDEQNNYRYYDIESMFKLGRILFLKNLGISLNEIDDYMKHKNAESLLKLLKKKQDEIDLKINQLTNLKHKINTKLDLFEHAKTKLDKIMVSEFDYRYGIFLKTTGLKSGHEIKEAFIRNENYLKMSNWLVEGQVYTSIPKEDMVSGIYNQYRYFIEINPLSQEVSDHLEILPKGLYACMTVIGPYEDLEKHYHTLTQWISNHGFMINGDSIENNIVDSDFSDSEDEFITELQIPIIMK